MIWRGIDLSFQNWHRNLTYFDALKSLKNLHFNGILMTNAYNVWAKKVQRSYLSEHWRLMQNFKKKNLWFRKWHEEFGKFSSENLKGSKFGLWWDPFVQSRKCISLKFTEELSVMKMKNDAKFEEKLTCHFKIDMKNLTNLDLNTQKSKKTCSFMGSFDHSI